MRFNLMPDIVSQANTLNNLSLECGFAAKSISTIWKTRWRVKTCLAFIEYIAVSIGWLCLGRFALLVTWKGFVAKLKSCSLQHEEQIQPNLTWALVIVRNGFVAYVLSQNLKINSLNTDTNNDKYPIAFFVCWCFSSEVLFAGSWLRCSSQNAEIHQGRRGHHDDSPNLVGAC